ncbi:MAG: hypothetical protein L3K17_07865, partial [Thermoplasmata archaeon]|nr:hypothetical protein [Thermoplasmata archaeon]
MQGDQWPSTPGFAWGGTYDATTGEVWFGDSQGSAVFGVNGTTGNETRAVWIPISAYQRNLSGAVSAPEALVYDPYHQVLAVAALSADSVTLLNASSAVIEHVVKLSAPWSELYDPSNHLIYVGGGDQNVTVIDGGNGSIVAKIRVPGWINRGLAYDAVAERVLGVSHDYSRPHANGYAYVIDDISQKVVANFTSSTIDYPESIAFDSLNGQVYVLDTGDGYTTNISVFNATTLAPLPTLNVAGSPVSLGVNPVRDEVYMSCTGPGLAIIYGSNDTVQLHGVQAVGGGCVTTVVFNPAADSVLIVGSSGSVERINASSDQP